MKMLKIYFKNGNSTAYSLRDIDIVTVEDHEEHRIYDSQKGYDKIVE